MKKLIFLVILLPIFCSLFAGGNPKINSLRNQITDEEKITLSRQTQFSIALKSIEILSQKFEGKKILNTSKFDDQVGTPLNQLYWKDALKLIVYYNNLTLEELPGVYLVKDSIIEAETEESKIVDINEKTIEISAVFFQMDKSFLNTLGIDWSTIASGSVIANITQSSGSKVQDQIISAGIGTVIDNGNVRINLDALLKMIESNQNGTVIARPKITVLSGKTGSIQVGEDFSVKTTDESGNITDEFFSAGVILEVKPQYISDGDLEGIHLKAKVEKSSASPSEISTVIKKSVTNTEVILYDGEETVMAGMYTTEELSDRGGIPILKDLPWWFLGIRYLAGYTKTEVKQREMIIVLSASILDSLGDRESNNAKISETIKKDRKYNNNIQEIFKTEEKDEN